MANSGLFRKCDVVNRGLSGYNSKWAKILLPRLFPNETSEHIVGVTVFFGANDCALEGIYYLHLCVLCIQLFIVH